MLLPRCSDGGRQEVVPVRKKTLTTKFVRTNDNKVFQQDLSLKISDSVIVLGTEKLKVASVIRQPGSATFECYVKYSLVRGELEDTRVNIVYDSVSGEVKLPYVTLLPTLRNLEPPKMAPNKPQTSEKTYVIKKGDTKKVIMRDHPEIPPDKIPNTPRIGGKIIYHAKAE